MNRTLFIYYGPHFVHASFARVLNADFLPIDFKIGWREKPKFPNKFFGVISSILSLPKEYRIYLCESTYVIPAFSRKLHLLGDGKLAKKEIKDLRLTIVGKWQPKKEWLIEGVNFVGHQPSLEPYIQSSSLYVHLGRGEAFGISVLEAMLGGLPAIVSEWTGAKEVVQNLGSDFISKLNYEDASNKIMKYFDLSLEKKIKLSKKAKSLASKFKEDEKLRSFKEKFYKLLEELK